MGSGVSSAHVAAPPVQPAYGSWKQWSAERGGFNALGFCPLAAEFRPFVHKAPGCFARFLHPLATAIFSCRKKISQTPALGGARRPEWSSFSLSGDEKSLPPSCSGDDETCQGQAGVLECERVQKKCALCLP